ncbi:MAG: hypothetical protein ACRDIB_01185 [Ardenticatenaceae bacterium]
MRVPDRPHLKVGLLALLGFFLLACACSFDNPLSRGAEPTANPSLAGVELGEVVMAGAIGANSAPEDIRATFSRDDQVIYVVVQAPAIAVGTSLSAVWSRNGKVFETTSPVTAERPYEDAHIEFHIQTQGQTQFEPGDYSVQILINGSPGPTTTFTVQ